VTCVPEIFLFQKIWGQSAMFDPHVNVRGSFDTQLPCRWNRMMNSVWLCMIMIWDFAFTIVIDIDCINIIR